MSDRCSQSFFVTLILSLCPVVLGVLRIFILVFIPSSHFQFKEVIGNRYQIINKKFYNLLIFVRLYVPNRFGRAVLIGKNKNAKSSIFVGILHFGSCDLIRDLLSALDISKFNVCVVDHNAQPLEDLSSEVNYLWNPANPGYACGMNRLIREAQGEQAQIGLFLTNDVIISKQDLLLWINMLEKNDYSVEQPILVSVDHKIRSGIQYYPAEFHWPISPWRNRSYGRFYKDYYATGFVCGACFAIDMIKFNTDPVFFDEDFFMYYEDQEWSSRLKDSGHCFAVNSRIPVIHKESMSTGGGISWNGIKLRWNGLTIFLSKMQAAPLNAFVSRLFFIIRMVILLIKHRVMKG